MLKVDVKNVISRKVRAEIFRTMIIVSLTINLLFASVAVADELSEVAISGVYLYSPTAPNYSYVDVTVAPKDVGKTATLI